MICPTENSDGYFVSMSVLMLATILAQRFNWFALWCHKHCHGLSTLVGAA